VGNAGCPLHPRPRVHFVLVESTRVTTSTPESPGIPARNGFNSVCRALPGDRALLPPSFADMFLSKPGWADLNSANLTPASGRQDHTILPYAKSISRQRAIDRSQAFRPALRSHRAQNAAASTATHPASVTIAIRPSGGVGWREFVEMICPTGEAKYFCKEDSTQKCPTGKSLHGSESKFRWCPGWNQSVIPRCAVAHRGCATWRRPAIHTPGGGDGFRARARARPGMTPEFDAARCAASGERPEPAGRNNAPAMAKR
jgi:hypothetical protein